MLEIKNSKKVYVAWTNTDLNEGRGNEVPLFIAKSPETAKRLGKGKSVQGANCRISEEIAITLDRNGYKWLVPGVIHNESAGDKQIRLKREAKEAAILKAKAAGLTDSDILAMTT